MRAPTFQLMPKMRFIPAPLPEILPKVKKRQEKNKKNRPLQLGEDGFSILP